MRTGRSMERILGGIRSGGWLIENCKKSLHLRVFVATFYKMKFCEASRPIFEAGVGYTRAGDK